MNEHAAWRCAGGGSQRRTGGHEVRAARMTSGDADAPMSPEGAKRPNRQIVVIDVQAR